MSVPMSDAGEDLGLTKTEPQDVTQAALSSLLGKRNAETDAKDADTPGSSTNKKPKTETPEHTPTGQQGQRPVITPSLRRRSVLPSPSGAPPVPLPPSPQPPSPSVSLVQRSSVNSHSIARFEVTLGNQTIQRSVFYRIISGERRVWLPSVFVDVYAGDIHLMINHSSVTAREFVKMTDEGHGRFSFDLSPLDATQPRGPDVKVVMRAI